MRFKCQKKPGCLRCTACCHFREKAILSDKEDYALRKQMWDSKYILYAYPFYRYTISLSNEEKQTLQSLAKKLNLELKFIPKKIIFNQNQEPEVLDWCIDADVCPFLKDDACLIYNQRPAVCKSFPNDFIPNIKNKLILDQNFSFEEALDKIKTLKD